MKTSKIAPVVVLVVGMGAAAWVVNSTLATVDEGEDKGVEAPFMPRPAPVRVEATKRGGALNALSAGKLDLGDAGGRADGGVASSAEEVGRGGALAHLDRRRRAQRADDEGQPEEDWSEGERAPVGPARWMPERLSEEEAHELQSELDEGEMRQAQLLAMREDRQRSIDVVAPRVGVCFEELRAREPERQGRLALNWTMLAGGGVGVIGEVQVRANVGLREPGFEACVVQVEGLTFEATGESELLVEWVFMPGEP
ncbi:hypothetical protein FRC98_19500 [Lujinxingia vulgaris]|uniref:Uncharacterized protein n=1 Tax=Lujinxingia vulgaris TaxID=2600176 RepID=A0A5C6WXA0_9DELT|nr:hypothetical protein [Lujinxingia vulgaris]TXD34047.1 hypothetical protein FRC98_19500 [Lujinxingia vulgaris]